MASNMKANDGAGRIDRMAGLARDDGNQLDVANNQANMFIRNNLANLAAADILENLGNDPQEDEEGEPSNFQAWYVRSANNSRSRERSEARLEVEQDSEPDQDMDMGEHLEELEEVAGVDQENSEDKLDYEPQERFERQYRSLSLEQAETGSPAENLAQLTGAPSLQSLPTNHNPFLGEPLAAPVGNGNYGAVPRRNSGYVRNVNQGPGTLYNWQATKTTVKERFAFMFNNEILADVHFKVRFIGLGSSISCCSCQVGRGGAEQRIPAHKFGGNLISMICL